MKEQSRRVIYFRHRIGNPSLVRYDRPTFAKPLAPAQPRKDEPSNANLTMVIIKRKEHLRLRRKDKSTLFFGICYSVQTQVVTPAHFYCHCKRHCSARPNQMAHSRLAANAYKKLKPSGGIDGFRKLENVVKSCMRE